MPNIPPLVVLIIIVTIVSIFYFLHIDQNRRIRNSILRTLYNEEAKPIHYIVDCIPQFTKTEIKKILESMLKENLIEIQTATQTGNTYTLTELGLSKAPTIGKD